jgi:uncharacterized membrane protein YfcA
VIVPLEPIVIYIVLFVAAVFAGLIDSIAGGGGLIALPALLSVGVPPQAALGTNKLQSMFGTFTAAMHYRRSGLVRFREERTGFFITFFFAGIGAWTVQQVDSRVLGYIIPFFLLFIALYTIVTPSLGRHQVQAKFSKETFFLIAGSLLGFYDGFFGPGVGSFWAVMFMSFLGYEIRKATAHTKVMNLSSNIISVIVFSIGGSVLFLYGLIMAAGQIIGARIGAHLAVKNGIAVIRPVYIVVVLATIAKLLWDRLV